MSENIRYSRAPLTEAILDITMVPRPGLAPSDFLPAFQAIKEYPTLTNLQFTSGQFRIGEAIQSTISSPTLVGYKFGSADGRDLVQIRPERFTVNRLAPYTSWERMSADAKRLWGIYRSVHHSPVINRVALRYVNRIEIPKEFIELKDYFLSYPEVSPQLPQVMATFFYQVVIPLEDIESAVRVIMTLDHSRGPANVGVILDLDLFRDTEGLGEEMLWPLFEKLRSKKNYVFEACITDKVRELIK